MSSDDDAPLMHPTFFQLKAKPPAASAGGLPLPPAAPMPGPNGLPIFVMAPDPAAAAAAAAPPQVGHRLVPVAGCVAVAGSALEPALWSKESREWSVCAHAPAPTRRSASLLPCSCAPRCAPACR